MSRCNAPIPSPAPERDKRAERERNTKEGANVSKYGNIKTEIDGITFQSKKEAGRYRELKLLERAGHITELQCQKRFEIIPKIGREQAANYTCDFAYRENGALVVEDVKSKATKTQAYVLRRKLLNWRYGIEIREV